MAPGTDYGSRDLGMTSNLRGLVPRVSCCWGWHEAGGGKDCKGKLRQVGECASKPEHPRYYSVDREEL